MHSGLPPPPRAVCACTISPCLSRAEPLPRLPAPSRLQVYSRVERRGEDFMSHFGANFKVHIISESPDELV